MKCSTRIVLSLDRLKRLNTELEINKNALHWIKLSLKLWLPSLFSGIIFIPKIYSVFPVIFKSESFYFWAQKFWRVWTCFAFMKPIFRIDLKWHKKFVKNKENTFIWHFYVCTVSFTVFKNPSTEFIFEPITWNIWNVE